MPRELNDQFMKDLLNGTLKELLEFVKCDETLDFEIRDNEVHIYYRGGKILGLKPKNSGYKYSFDDKYLKALKPGSVITAEMLKKSRESNNWEEYFAYAKGVIDMYFNIKGRYEREFQQLIVRENNYSGISNDTDYFVLDIEYDNRAGARFDIVALEWVATGPARKSPKDCKLVVFEMKYGDGALTGRAGINKHVTDFNSFISNQSAVADFKKEMLTIFKQKRELGLIKFARKGNKYQVEDIKGDIKLAFIIANHKAASSILRRELNNASGLNNIKFIVSNFMGYGLYKNCLYDYQGFVAKFEEQI
jgi:hypothetical protein